METRWAKYAQFESHHFWDRAAELEELEDCIWEQQAEIRTSVHRDVWRLYLIEGKEGLEEVVRRWEAEVQVMEAEDEERDRAWEEYFRREGEGEGVDEDPEDLIRAPRDGEDDTPPLTDEEIRDLVAGNEETPLQDYWEGEYAGEYVVEEHWEIESV